MPSESMAVLTHSTNSSLDPHHHRQRLRPHAHRLKGAGARLSFCSHLYLVCSRSCCWWFESGWIMLALGKLQSCSSVPAKRELSGQARQALSFLRSSSPHILSTWRALQALQAATRFRRRLCSTAMVSSGEQLLVPRDRHADLDSLVLQCAHSHQSTASSLARAPSESLSSPLTYTQDCG